MASVVEVEELSRETAVNDFFKVNNFTREAGYDDSYVGGGKEITRHHWKLAANYSRCPNPSCQKPFSGVFERRHHCRKCGEVFCNSCTQYKRRLNKLAHYDPDGQLYKVCKACFENGLFTDGQIRSHTSDFRNLRSFCRKQAIDSGKVLSLWRSQIDFQNECQRLIDGFASSVGTSEISKTLHDLRNVISKPEWTKSITWIQENTVTKCRKCEETFGLMRKKHFCSLCGLAVCKTCSCKDLLLYVPDGEKDASKKVKLAIIKIVGCPEVEPEISLHLRVCPDCRDRLITQQVEEVEEEELYLDSSFRFMDNLNKLHLKFHEAEEGVRLQLPNYMSVIESLEDGTRAAPKQNNMKILAKAQEDLVDALARHVTLIQQLKKLTPPTQTQNSLFKTYIRAKCDFYLDNMSLFRLVKSKLTNSIPAECLDFIQRTMDKNAIISTHLALRQLVYEVLHLTYRHSIEDDLPAFLISVEEEIEKEVKKCLSQGGEDVDEHMKYVKELTEIAMKERKLIRFSRRAFKTKGTIYLYQNILDRSEAILNQVINQLQLASANRSFQAGKKSLEDAMKDIKERKTKGLNEKQSKGLKEKQEREVEGFVVV